MRSQIANKTAISKTIFLAIAIPWIASGLLISCNSPNNRPKQSVNQKLLGTWEFQNLDGVKNGMAVFEPKNDRNGGIEGDVYILTTDLPSGRVAIAGKYKTNSSTNLQQLDLIFGDLTTQTIYEIDNDGQLKIANTVPEQPRPTILESNPQRLIKVSDRTTIANEIKILRSPDLISSSALIREAESKSNVRAIGRLQQQIFQEKGLFSVDVNQLMMGLPFNSEYYSYKVTILGDAGSGQAVQNSAIPLKQGLKAYTGIVYAIASADANQKTTKSIVCESNIPTKAIPQNPKIQDEGYSCPDAYTSINP
ncbi:MAG: hypothetical protein DCF19_11340 [Pseudanabaena frigida]|uniref:General secretion pathway protein GspH n=1 Tax=Pseudanabaena frigida TaxID=945775 RepID=A0A2W4WF19_9CYAN|nr:MAG: hypothetical protein DCF19_11340 [Pseudanabaena frigida]